MKQVEFTGKTPGAEISKDSDQFGELQAISGIIATKMHRTLREMTECGIEVLSGELGVPMYLSRQFVPSINVRAEMMPFNKAFYIWCPIRLVFRHQSPYGVNI